MATAEEREEFALEREAARLAASMLTLHIHAGAQCELDEEGEVVGFDWEGLNQGLRVLLRGVPEDMFPRIEMHLLWITTYILSRWAHELNTTPAALFSEVAMALDKSWVERERRLT